MPEDDKTKSGNAGTQNPTAKELGASHFRTESIEEICQLATVAWFPGAKSAKDTEKHGGSVEVTGYEVSFVDTAKALGSRARENDHDALLRLVIMAMAAQLELWQLAKNSPLLQRASQHSVFWFLPSTQIGGLGRIFKDAQNLFNVASFLLKFRKIRGNLDIPINACAFKLLAYMVLAKRGFIKDPHSVLLGDPCAKLPQLSETTWNTTWWATGKNIAKDMFPDLDVLLFGPQANPQDKERNYSAAIHQLGLAFKHTWPLFKGIENAVLPSKVKDGSNDKAP